MPRVIRSSNQDGQSLDEGLVSVLFEGHLVEYAFNDLDDLALAYATSIHKAQGSEYPAIVIPLAMQHYRLQACMGE